MYTVAIQNSASGFIRLSTVLAPVISSLDEIYCTVFEFGDVFCFTDFLSGFLFRVRGRVRVNVGVGGGFRVRVAFRACVRAR